MKVFETSMISMQVASVCVIEDDASPPLVRPEGDYHTKISGEKRC